MSKTHEVTSVDKETSSKLPSSNKLPSKNGKGVSNGNIDDTLPASDSSTISLTKCLLNGNNFKFIDADSDTNNDTSNYADSSPSASQQDIVKIILSTNVHDDDDDDRDDVMGHKSDNHLNTNHELDANARGQVVILNDHKKDKDDGDVDGEGKYTGRVDEDDGDEENKKLPCRQIAGKHNGCNGKKQHHQSDKRITNEAATHQLDTVDGTRKMDTENSIVSRGHRKSDYLHKQQLKNLQICLNKCSNNNNNDVCYEDRLKIGRKKLCDAKSDAKNINISVNCENGVDDDEDGDPYAELEFYLDKVKREINEVFEQFKLSDGLHRSTLDSSNKLLPEKRNISASSDSKVNKIGSKLQENVQNEKVIKTAEWANTILKELDNLMQSDKRRTAKSADHDVHLVEKNAAKCNILKPEKHTCIPLQSFDLEKSIRDSPITNGNGKHLSDFPFSQASLQNLPVLKIEEDAESYSSLEKKENNADSKTISTQTNFGDPKKGSTSTIWTSDESILRSTVDDDNKSTSSSACEVASGVLSSGKSGNSLDSSELDNENNESGIGTATPPKDPDVWRGQKKCLDSISFQNYGGKHTWVRREDVTTQTSPTAEPDFTKSNAIDDPLEVLSLCEGAEDDYDFLEEDWHNQTQDKLLDSSFCTDSSCSTKSGSLEHSDTDVILRNHRNISNYSPQNRFMENSKIPSQFVLRLPERYQNGRKNSKSESEGSVSLNHDTVYGSYERNFDTPPETRRPFCLQINHEPFQHMNELPSPSSASLHSGNVGLKELCTKSNSAPILLKKEKRKDDFAAQVMNLRYSRSHSDRYLTEIEAIEACKWLRAAGFPQYAQMYEDLQFPIDLSNVAKDHPFLENDPLQSLYRRLVALNRCATMRLDSAHKQHPSKDESEDDEYALSDNWTFEQKNRRWSRVDENDITKSLFDKADKNLTSRESSPERDDLNPDSLGFTTLPLAMSLSQHEHQDTDQLPVRFRRSGSERLKDGAKAFLRRVESIKSRRRKRQNRDGVVISEPQALNLSQMNQKMNDLKCVEIGTMSTPPSPIPASPYTVNSRNLLINNNDLKVLSEYSKYTPNRLSPRHMTSHKIYQTSQSNRTSPLHFFSNNPNIVIELKSGDESSSYYSDASQDSGGGGGCGSQSSKQKRSSRSRRFLQMGSKVEDIGAVSDSECHHLDYVNQKYFKDSNSNNSELKPPKLSRGGSLNLGKESNRYRDAFKSKSFRSRSSSRRKDHGDDKDSDSKAKSGTSVVRWHSFQSHDRPDFIFKKCYSNRLQESEGMSLAAMSCGQLQVIRKLALVTLTGYMERYCPTHRSGWNWELPKFIKKIKAPDYKDKKVFGVPFSLLLQRTGETLPKSIQTALKWLKLNAMDQIGIFRKSGVKSRIQKLKSVVEETPVESMSLYDIQQAYDVADMVKQYFRELPDMLLTAKMSETFMAIFQHLPPEVRPDAVQCGVLLLPDEHREVLQHLLEFLHNVAENSDYNQMTANNLAVCLAPSLFHGVMPSVRTNAASPRRRKATGVPDPRELSETKASHECLTYLIENCRAVFTISSEKIIRCNFGYMEDSRPVPLEALGEGLQVHDWRGYLYECVSATIKEGRERSRGWVSTSTFDNNVEIAYKKVGDGHPLRLWRCITEVEAPPTDVLHYVFKERHNWDQHLLKWRIIDQLDEKSQIYQYATGAQTVTDFCVLRSWRSDLPRGACVIVETSVDHPVASLLMGGVRGVVLASRYLIEPCGSGRSKIMHLARVDIKGKTPEWYNKTYGHISSHQLARIRNAFKQIAEGPESKV